MANKVLKTDGTTEILRLIKTALANKQDKLMIDQVLDKDSKNPVENGAIYDAIKDLVSAEYKDNKLTLTSYKGDKTEVEIPEIDDLYKAVSYDTTDHKLTFTKVDDSTEDIDLSELYNIYDVEDTDEIDMTLDSDNKISAEIKEGSVKREKLHTEVTDELDDDRKDIDDIIGQLASMSSTDSADLGDTPIVPLLDVDPYVWRKIDVADENGNYSDERTGGYAFTGNKFTVLNKPFDRIKVNVYTPGWLRIGIIRGTGINEYDGVARGFCRANHTLDMVDTYPTSLLPDNEDGHDTTADGKPHTMLRKWLVCQWIASPGVHVFDIPETVITSPLEYIYCEDRTGISGFAMNRSGAAVTGNGLSIPTGTIPNAQSWPTTFVSATNFNSGSYAVSRNMLDASCDIVYCGAAGGPQISSWMNLSTTNNTVDRVFTRGEEFGWLNIGLYKRGNSGTIDHAPVVENAIQESSSSVSTRTPSSCMAAWIPDYDGQQELAKSGKEIYAIDLIITTPGELTMYRIKGTDPATAQFMAAYTIPFRAIGRQTVHLPEPIVLGEGEYLAFGGLTEAAIASTAPLADIIDSSTQQFKQGYADTAQFAYCATSHKCLTIDNWTCFGDDPTGIKNGMTPYSGVSKRLARLAFNSWSNVKLVEDADHYKHLDFTGATYNDNEFDPETETGAEEYLNIALVARSGKHSKLEDKNVSITGDSITTYRGTISQTTDFGSVVNGAGDNAIFYPNAASGAVNSPDQTWWGVLIKNNRARLIHNDAWSGSQVGGTESATSSTAAASTIRARMLGPGPVSTTANTTGGPRHPYGNPEVIFCMIGTNDLSSGRTVGAYSNTAPSDISTLLGAFQTMIAKHKTYYPYAKLVYFMIPRGSTYPYPYYNGTTQYSISQMASQMEYIAHAMGAHFVPLNYFEGLDRTQSSWTSTTGYTHPRLASGQVFGTTDRLHPNIMGNQIIANGLTRYVEENF